MVSKKELDILRGVDIISCDISSLADLSQVTVDTSLPPAKRLDGLIRQGRNPYLFRVGDVTVKVECLGKRPLGEALTHLMTG